MSSPWLQIYVQINRKHAAWHAPNATCYMTQADEQSPHSIDPVCNTTFTTYLQSNCKMSPDAICLSRIISCQQRHTASTVTHLGPNMKASPALHQTCIPTVEANPNLGRFRRTESVQVARPVHRHAKIAQLPAESGHCNKLYIVYFLDVDRDVSVEGLYMRDCFCLATFRSIGINRSDVA